MSICNAGGNHVADHGVGDAVELGQLYGLPTLADCALVVKNASHLGCSMVNRDCRMYAGASFLAGVGMAVT
jgi:hypothetical protein